MKPKISKKQLISIFNLLNDLKNFENKGIGKVLNLLACYNYNFPGTIFIRYEKDFINNGERTYDFNIAQISSDGVVKFIDGEFKTPYERYAFLGECKIFDINDETNYELID